MLRRFFQYFGGMIIHPRKTLDELSQESSIIRFAILLVVLGLLLTLFNLLLFTLFGYDWLGTRHELANPTYVGLFGRLRVGTEGYVTIFNFVLNPLLALIGLIFIPGIAQLLSKIWRGNGSFEQMVNTIVFAMGVPSIVISSVLNDLLLGGVLPNLLTGHPYAFTAAQTGELGPLMQTLPPSAILPVIATGLWIVVFTVLAIWRFGREEF